jgi:transmembrane sensor
MKTSRRESAVHDEAALWAARLDGDVLDADQRAALDAWLSEDDSRRALLSSYCQFSADLEEKVQALRKTGNLTVPSTSASSRRKVWTFPRVASVALAAAAAVAVAVWVALPKPQQQDFYAGIAQRQAHTLADGTRVELNAHTTLRFENSKTERRVRLASGEALFAVAKDFTRPFIVETPSGAVQVTGTTFNVRHDTGAIALQVTVVEGSVQVRPSIPAGDQASGPVMAKSCSTTCRCTRSRRDWRGITAATFPWRRKSPGSASAAATAWTTSATLSLPSRWRYR